MVFLRRLLILMLTAVASSSLLAEDGYELWMRYGLLSVPNRVEVSQIVCQLPTSQYLKQAHTELKLGLKAMLGRSVPLGTKLTKQDAVVIGTPLSNQLIGELNVDLGPLHDEAFVYLPAVINGKRVHVITGHEMLGVMYGSFWFLRQLQSGKPLPTKRYYSAPRYNLRLLNHWDNLNRSVERGYAGQSIWDWHKLPEYVDPRITDYARANASIGINGTVLTNVNANAMVLRADYILKTKAIADTLRPYGIKVYLTARFSAPIELGGLKTADPQDPQVRQWWKEKVAEIYGEIHDFGGFVVKANSEGQPGPQNYGRSHADGANMIAEALGLHGGILMWRAFVYDDKTPVDRAAQAYNEFKPLDGKFLPNVIVQVKNGPIDFQPREPFSPLFGALQKTPSLMEVQVTKEYLGFATHLAYLGTMWQEALASPTRLVGKQKVLDTLTGIAGVSNIGSDRNWCGSHFDQANWYALGRLAWDPTLGAERVADEWARMTFGPAVAKPIGRMMMRSREAVVNYTGPLGLTHLMATGHHYGPGPWVNNLGRADWNPVYFHRANQNGIGFDRVAAGTLKQYAPGWQEIWGKPSTTPDNLLLWFHHVPWTHCLGSGKTVWEELVSRYTSGVSEVASMQDEWAKLKSKIDPARHGQVTEFLKIQHKEAKWWRDASIAYWQSLNGLPLPKGFDAPEHSLEYYKSISHPYAPGNTHTG
ncbi:MAG: alpha-glucuronidase family glycosyl hydrolase [Armatimonadota bacterium]